MDVALLREVTGIDADPPVQPGGAARGAVIRTVQGDLDVSATTAMLFFAGARLVALIIIALLTLRHSPNPLITSTSKETLS